MREKVNYTVRNLTVGDEEEIRVYEDYSMTRKSAGSNYEFGSSLKAWRAEWQLPKEVVAAVEKILFGVYDVKRLHTNSEEEHDLLVLLVPWIDKLELYERDSNLWENVVLWAEDMLVSLEKESDDISETIKQLPQEAREKFYEIRKEQICGKASK